MKYHRNYRNPYLPSFDEMQERIYLSKKAAIQATRRAFLFHLIQITLAAIGVLSGAIVFIYFLGIILIGMGYLGI